MLDSLHFFGAAYESSLASRGFFEAANVMLYALVEGKAQHVGHTVIANFNSSPPTHSQTTLHGYDITIDNRSAVVTCAVDILHSCIAVRYL